MPTLRISSWTPQKSDSAESNKSSDSESEPDLESSKKKPPKKKPRLEKKDLKPYESIIQNAVETSGKAQLLFRMAPQLRFFEKSTVDVRHNLWKVKNL